MNYIVFYYTTFAIYCYYHFYTTWSIMLRCSSKVSYVILKYTALFHNITSSDTNLINWYIVQCHIKSYCVTWPDMIVYDMLLYHSTLCCTAISCMFCWLILCCIIWCSILLYCVTLHNLLYNTTVYFDIRRVGKLSCKMLHYAILHNKYVV